jgi:hypothetical protein
VGDCWGGDLWGDLEDSGTGVGDAEGCHSYDTASDEETGNTPALTSCHVSAPEGAIVIKRASNAITSL